MNKRRSIGYLPSWGFLLLIAFGACVYLLMHWVDTPPLVRSTVAKNDIFKSSLVTYVEVVNFGYLEGPYPIWKLPVVRWGMGPENRMRINCPESTQVDVMLQTRSAFQKQRLKIVVNGRVEHTLAVPAPSGKGAFQPVRFRVPLKKGSNELVLKYAKWKQGQNDRRPMAVLFSSIQIEKEIDGPQGQSWKGPPMDIFQGAAVTFDPPGGFRALEGPYPKWQLPLVRWGLAPESRVAFHCAEARPAGIHLRVRTLVQGQTMKIELNGLPLGSYPVREDLPPGEFQEILVEASLVKGKNVMRIEYTGSLKDADPAKDPLAVLFAVVAVE